MRRIGIVDDEPDITAVIKKGLEQHGFAVDTFNDPQLVLSSFQPKYYDLMIIDLRMPNISGFDLYRELKMRDNDVKVFFLTAFEIYYEEFGKVFPNIDVSAFIRKPVSILALVRQINAVLEVP